MNTLQIQALIRQTLSILGGYFVGAGYLSAAESEALIGAAMVILGVGWSLYASRKVGVIDAASKLNEVASIQVTSPNIAVKTSSDKVTTEL